MVCEHVILNLSDRNSPQPTSTAHLTHSGPQSLGSSGGSEYDTPTSTTPTSTPHSSLSKEETAPSDVESTSRSSEPEPVSSDSLDQLKELEKLRKMRREISNLIHRVPTASAPVVVSNSSPKLTHGATTSVHPAKKQPVKNPPFHETILEEPTSGTFCSKCGNKISPGQGQCSYCSMGVSSHGSSPATTSSTQSNAPPTRLDTQQPSLPPPRASPAGAKKAMEEHRRTHALNIISPAPPAGAAALPTSGSRSAFGAMNTGRGLETEPGRGAEGGGYAGATGGGATGGGASSGGAEGKLPQVSPEKTYREVLKEKEEYWKNLWKKKGYKDSEIPAVGSCDPKTFPDKPEVKREKKPKHKKQGEGALGDLDRYREEEKRRKRMEEMAEEGESFMQCIKVC